MAEGGGLSFYSTKPVLFCPKIPELFTRTTRQGGQGGQGARSQAEDQGDEGGARNLAYPSLTSLVQGFREGPFFLGPSVVLVQLLVLGPTPEDSHGPALGTRS